MKLKHLLWAAGTVFALTLIAQLPAALVFTATKPKTSQFEAYGLQGPWTRGQLSGLTSKGRLIAQDLHWRFKPLQLLLGRAAFAIEGGGELATLQGGVALAPGSVRLSDFRLAGNLKKLAATVGFPYVPVDGQLGGEIEQLRLTKGLIEHFVASLDLRGLAWTLARDPLLLGDFHAEVTTTDEAVIAAITSPSGPLEAEGEMRLTPDKKYDIDIKLKPKPGASEMLINYVHSVGNPDPQGYFHLRQKGQLP